jgi:hypothetical protein
MPGTLTINEHSTEHSRPACNYTVFVDVNPY